MRGSGQGHVKVREREGRCPSHTLPNNLFWGGFASPNPSVKDFDMTLGSVCAGPGQNRERQQLRRANAHMK
jgi:hypothetical protein